MDIHLAYFHRPGSHFLCRRPHVFFHTSSLSNRGLRLLPLTGCLGRCFSTLVNEAATSVFCTWCTSGIVSANTRPYSHHEKALLQHLLFLPLHHYNSPSSKKNLIKTISFSMFYLYQYHRNVKMTVWVERAHVGHRMTSL